MTVKRSLIAVSAVFIVIFLVLLFSFTVQSTNVKDDQEQMARTVTLLRAAGNVDMRHDGIRGTVFQHLLGLQLGDRQMIREAREVFDEHRERMSADYSKILSTQVSDELASIAQRNEQSLKVYYRSAGAILDSDSYTEALTQMALFNQAFDELEEGLEALGDGIQAAYTSIRGKVESELQSELIVMSVLIVLGIVLGSAAMFLFGRRLLTTLGEEPAYLSVLAREIAAGNLDQELKEGTGLYGTLREMRDQLKEQIERDREQLKISTRLKEAIETTSTAIMVADEGFNITYMNPAVNRVLKNAEPEIRKTLPQFNADELIGQNIDFFHKNPAHQRQLLSSLKAPHKASLSLGGSYFDLTAGTIRDDDGEILGFVVEWKDVSAQVYAEREVQQIVASAREGDLKQRLELEGKEGFFLNLSKGLNEFVQSVDDVLDDIDAVVGKMSRGDMSGRMDTSYEGQYKRIAEAVNSSMTRLSDIVGQLMQTSESVRAANQEISSGNNQLSERTEKQSSSLEETASSMEELASNVRNTADNSRQADQLSSHARDSATKGGEVIERTVASMAEINDASRKIAEIIGVIDDIAFQTNLLALNASVEAARAGEQGRGFAVVATEVRNLAQRSATSAKEIKELIEDSVSKVQAGSKLVNESGENLNDIIGNVKKVSDLISDIAAATEEQSAGIEEINRAIAELDEITQQNAALAEETASSAESSLDSVGQMVQVISFFQVDDQAVAPVRMAQAPHRPVSPPTVAAPKPAGRSAPKPPAKPEADDDDWEEF